MSPLAIFFTTLPLVVIRAITLAVAAIASTYLFYREKKNRQGWQVAIAGLAFSVIAIGLFYAGFYVDGIDHPSESDSTQKTILAIQADISEIKARLAAGSSLLLVGEPQIDCSGDTPADFSKYTNQQLLDHALDIVGNTHDLVSKSLDKQNGLGTDMTPEEKSNQSRVFQIDAISEYCSKLKGEVGLLRDEMVNRIGTDKEVNINLYAPPTSMTSILNADSDLLALVTKLIKKFNLIARPASDTPSYVIRRVL